MNLDFELIRAPDPQNSDLSSVELNSIDKTLIGDNISYCFLFKNKEKSLNFMPSALMIESLKSVLNYFPEMTGRVNWCPESGEPKIDFSNHGVKFQTSEIPLRDDQIFVSNEKLGEKFWQFSNEFQSAMEIDQDIVTENRSVPLSIRLIRTLDRSVLLSFLALHAICDGFGFVNLFLANWGRASRRKEMLMLDTRVLIRDQIYGTEIENAKLESDNEDCEKIDLCKPIQFIIGERQIRKLIAFLKKNAKNIDFVNETTAVFALLWTVHTQINPPSAQPASLYFPMDLRSQLSLPRSYMGNAVVPVTVTGLEAADPEQNEEEAMLIRAIDVIADALQTRNKQELQSLVHNIQRINDKSLQSVMISPVTHLNWDELDFGHGRFEWVLQSEPLLPRGLIVVFPAPESSATGTGTAGGVLVQTVLTDNATLNMAHNKLFRKYSRNGK